MKNPRFKKGLKFLIISFFLTLISLGGLAIFVFLFNKKSSGIEVQMVIVNQETVEDKITGENGVLKLENQRNLKSGTTGTVEKILVKVGDNVKKGQILIQLRNQEAQLKLKEFEVNLQDKNLQVKDKQLAWKKAEMKLLELQEEYKVMVNNNAQEIDKLKQDKSLEVEKQQLDVTRKQQALKNAQDALADLQVKLTEDQQLLAQGFISENELDNRQKEIKKAELDVTNAQDDLRLSEITLERQKLELNNFLESVEKELSEPQQKLKESRAKIEEAKQNVDQAILALNQTFREKEKLEIDRQKIIEELRQTTIISPVDGMILNIKVKEGDVIEAKSDIILIGDSNQKIVELKLTPLDASKIKIEQEAEVSLVGLESEKLTGKVQNISLLAGDDQSNINQNSEPIKVTAIVKLDQTDQTMFPGTPVTVDLIIAKAENVISIPNEVIQQNESETFVWVKDGENKARKKVIEIGLQGLLTTEVKSGLNVGDEVLIPPLNVGLQEGDMVTIKQN